MVSKNDNLCANALFAFLRATIAACLTLFLSSASVFAQVGGERAEYRLSADGKTFEQYHGPGGLFSVPEGVEKISGAAFMGYDALTSVEIPASVSSIGGGAFGACRALAAINVAEDNAYYRSIDGVLFTKDGKTLIKYPEGKDGENYSVPEGVQTLFDYAFGKCPSLKSVVLPESATTIGDRAFSECYALSSFAVPENVETIGGYAFAECSSLTSIVIPEKVSSIGRAAFSRCASLISIEVEEGNANYRSDDGVLYAKDGKTLIKYPPKREGESYAILGGAQTIEDGAFSASSSLKSIDVPNGVETIGTSAFSECVALESISFPGSVRTAGDFAFSFCPSLKTIDVAEDSANYRSIDGVLYSKDGTTLIRYPEGKENEEFVVPDNVASIAHGAFSYCSRLKSVVISEGVDKIEWSAFEGCAALESIVIPTSVKTIESNAFGGCYTLTIRSAEGSVAQEHAKQAGLKFESINEGAEANGNEEKDDVKKGGVHIVLVDATDLTPDVPGWKPLANVEKALYGFSNEFSGVPLLSNFQINMPASHCGELGGADVASFDVFKGSDARPINVLERCQELSGASGSDDAFFVFIAASASLRRSFNAVAVANALRSNNPRLIVVLTDFYSNTAKNYEGLRPKTETRKYVPEFLPKNDSYLKRFLTEAKGEVLVDSQTEPGLPPLIEISEGAGHFVGSRFEAAFARFAANGCYLESELTPKGFCTLINWEFSREILNYNSWGFGDARRQELTLYEDLGRQQTRLEKKELRTLDSLWRADAARFARLKKSGEFLENDGKLKFDMTTETFFSASK